MDDMPLVAQSNCKDGENGRHSSLWRRLNSCDQYSCVVAFSAEVSEENARYKRRMPGKDSRILVYIPSRRKSIGMHDQNRSWLPRVGELLDSADGVADGSVHGDQAARFSAGTDRSHDVSGAGVVEHLAIGEDFEDRNRRPASFAEGVMDVTQDALGGW